MDELDRFTKEGVLGPAFSTMVNQVCSTRA